MSFFRLFHYQAYIDVYKCVCVSLTNCICIICMFLPCTYVYCFSRHISPVLRRLLWE